MFGLITRGATVSIGAETGVLAVVNRTDLRLQVISASGTTTEMDNPAGLSHAGGGFVDRVLESGHTAAGPIDPAHDGTLGIPVSGARLTYAVGAGVRPPAGPPGALCVGFASCPADTALALWLLEGYARLVSLCLHDRGMLDGLLAAAHLDGLTGCLNYAAVRAELDREIHRAARHGRTLSCSFIDLDHFKRVNDRHGHLHGNRALAHVADILRDGVRVGDTVGRYGGDEFLAILPDTTEEEACTLAARLRARISATRPSGNTERLDMSVGVAQWRPGSTADELLGAADAALLRAKDGGGGIVVPASDGPAGVGRDGVRGAAGAR